jgi:cytoskeleton protein RodZ
MQEQDMDASAANSSAQALDLVELGRRLREARSASSLALDEVAQRLHLPLATVADLESGRSERIGTPIYLRGFLRSYLKLLALPEAWADLALGASDSATIPPILPAAGAVARRVPWIERYKWAASYVVGTALALTAVHWLVSNTPQLGFPDASRPAAAVDRPDATQTAVATEPSPTPPVAAEVPPPAVLVPATRNEESVVMASLNPFRVPADERSEAVAKDATLTLTFDQASWVDVRDAAGGKLAFQTVAAGERRTFNLSAPVSVLIGNARGVRADVAGTPVVIDTFVRGNIARFAVAREEQGWTAVTTDKDTASRDDG